MTTVKFRDTAAGGQAPNPGAAAYACARLGFRVFPLIPGAATPAIKAWPDYATADVDQIREWWTWEYPGYGVGIATGPESGVWVLDIDVKGGVDGFASLLDLRLARREYDITPFTRTMVVTTPSGGAHIYFRWSDGVVNSAKRLGPGLDVRAERGYVRAPGWGGYDVVPRGPEGDRVTRVAVAPAWLVELAKKRQRNYADDPARPATSWARFTTSRTLEVLRRCPAGTRNESLNKAAYKLGRAGSLSEGEAWEACRAVMVGIGAQDAEDAQRRTFESGWNAGVAARGSA